jgi:hypothetical protein
MVVSGFMYDLVKPKIPTTPLELLARVPPVEAVPVENRPLKEGFAAKGGSYPPHLDRRLYL